MKKQFIELSTANFGPMSDSAPSIQCAGSFDSLTGDYSFSISTDQLLFSLDYLKRSDIEEIASCLVAMMDSDLEANEDSEEVE
jgi:hypothetical protein